MTKCKITVTELRSKIYQVTKEVQRTGEGLIVTEHGEPVWKIVPLKKKAKSKALQAKTSKVKSKKQETIWEKWERLGPRNLFGDEPFDPEKYKVWDQEELEAVWKKKWNEMLKR